MALTKVVKKKTVKKTKSRKTSPGKKGEKLGRQQPKKKIVVKSKSEMKRIKSQAPDTDVIMSETEAGFDEVGDGYFDDLETEFDEIEYPIDAFDERGVNYPDKEY